MSVRSGESSCWRDASRRIGSCHVPAGQRGAARGRRSCQVNPEFLSRLQFALTASFHFIFPPISMGLGILLVWMAWKHVRTGDPVWRQSSVF
ncbi:MAG: cytochrome ubiquinol oxidase subunit I, partial [Actinomycetota bacterium]